MKKLFQSISIFIFITGVSVAFINQPILAEACTGRTTYGERRNGQECRCQQHNGIEAVQSGRTWKCVYQSGGSGNTSYWADVTDESDSGSTSIDGCKPPFDIPDACPSNYTPNFNCINRKLIDPSYSCCRNICKDQAGAIPIEEQPGVYQQLFSFFGRTIAISSGNQLVAIFNIGITTVLGMFTVFALVFGVYTAAIVRAKTTDEEEIANSNKTLINIIIGFTLAWSFLFIIQIVMGFLGMGNLSNLVFLDNNANDPNVIIIQ